MSNEIVLTEKVKAEDESYADDALFNITSFGTDIMLSQIVSMYKTGDIEKPDLQRNYVWTKAEASRFIDSILLGLPVPSIFLAKDQDNRLQIVDGYQRITTVCDYFEGIFHANNSVFKLSNKENIHPRWRNKSYSELNDAEQREIRTYSLHAIVFEQKHPSDNSGMYQIFERINTGGRILKPQEIRNSVYHGSFNDMLKNLNHSDIWRKILGNNKLDTRMSDVELILRFFAFLDIKNRSEFKLSRINLVKYLNQYMSDHININDDEKRKFTNVFNSIMEYIESHFGPHVFRTAHKSDSGELKWATKVNPVIFDAVCTATYLANKRSSLPQVSLESRYERLVTDMNFCKVTEQRTTNVDNIISRVNIAARILYNVELTNE